MLPGLLVACALGAPPEFPPVAHASGSPIVGPPIPGSPEAHRDAVTKFGTAVWNLRRERLLTAAKQLEAAAAQDPDATAPRRELVKVYSQIGREPDAIRIARQVLNRDPHDVDTAHALARLLFDAGELKDAVAAAKLAADAPIPIDRADKAVAVYRDLATLCERANDPAAAEVALRRAVELLVEKRKAVIAAAAFGPKDADTAAAECLERLGKVLTKQRKFDDAATAFESAAKLYADPKVNDAASAARLGWNLSAVHHAKGDAATALQHLRPFLKLKPVSPEPYARLATLLRETGQDAVSELLWYLERDPKNLTIKVVLAAEKARDPGTRRDADALFAEVTAASNDPKVIEVVVRSHLEQSRPDQIIAELDRAFALLDEKPDAKPVVTPEATAAKAFAAEKARVVGDILKDDAGASRAVLRAAADDLQTGKKRTYQVYYFLGQLAARHDQLGFAANLFQEAVYRAPRDTQVTAYRSLITVLRRAGKPEQVKRVCQDGLRDAQDIAPVFFNYYLAAALAELGDEQGAVAAADKAIAQTADSDRLTVRLQKLYVLRLLERWDDAIALGKKLFDEFESRADRINIRYALAGAYWGAKKTAEAEAELRAILDVEPDHAAACNDLGYHLADQGRNLDEAERLIRTAIAADRFDRKKAGDAEPENAAYVDSLGWVLFRKGKLADARAELERAAAMPAGAADPVVWDHLGDVLFRLGEKPKAKAAWETAEKLYEADARGAARGRRDGRLDELKRKLKRIP